MSLATSKCVHHRVVEQHFISLILVTRLG